MGIRVDPKSTWFIDNEPDSGIVGIIDGVSSTDRSWSSNQNNPGTTIAGHWTLRQLVERSRFQDPDSLKIMLLQKSQARPTE